MQTGLHEVCLSIGPLVQSSMQISDYYLGGLVNHGRFTKFAKHSYYMVCVLYISYMLNNIFFTMLLKLHLSWDGVTCAR